MRPTTTDNEVNAVSRYWSLKQTTSTSDIWNTAERYCSLLLWILLLWTTVFHGMRNSEQSHGMCPFPQNFYVFAEFCIGRWLRDKCGIFWPGLRGCRKLITVCRHDCAVKYVTDIRALMWGVLKILNLSEILPFYLVDRLYLSVAVTYWRQILQYLVGFRGHRKLFAIKWKLQTCLQQP